MAGNDSSISPYLLRPLRSLKQVLGGRSRVAESTRDNIEATPPPCMSKVRPEAAVERHRAARLTDHS
jgi:hypothetical protein